LKIAKVFILFFGNTEHRQYFGGRKDNWQGKKLKCTKLMGLPEMDIIIWG